MKILVTGARGFIGSAYIRNWCRDTMAKNRVVAFARNTNEWSAERLEKRSDVKWALEHGQLKLVYGDLNDDISGLCEGIEVVLNFASKTFVDHSIRDPKPFIESNTLGTVNLLEEARRQGVKAFINVSTDEVYGQILEGAYSEDAPLNPRNPYAASKAAADAMVQSYHHTFGMWTAVTRTENNYGPYQHPQKALPVFVANALNDKPIPVYGDGQHVRQWLNVLDHISGLDLLIEQYNELPGGEVWHIAGSQETTNMELAKTILRALDKPEDMIELIDDMNIRPGHDRRYALKCDKIRKIGWEPTIKLEAGIASAVQWYSENRSWL
jgi:dTDP-glucose 4,6-dehydratase